MSPHFNSKRNEAKRKRKLAKRNSETKVVATTDTSTEDDVAQYSNVATKGIGDAVVL